MLEYVNKRTLIEFIRRSHTHKNFNKHLHNNFTFKVKFIIQTSYNNIKLYSPQSTKTPKRLQKKTIIT
jgi:hypothetical protein